MGPRLEARLARTQTSQSVTCLLYTSLPLPEHGGVAVGREYDEGHVLVEGLRDGRPVVAGRRGGGARYHDGLTELLSKPKREVAGAAFIDDGIAGEIRILLDGMYEGDVAAAGREY